jgi:hypothetical protein
MKEQCFFIFFFEGEEGGTSAQDKVGCLDGKKNAYSSNVTKFHIFLYSGPFFTPSMPTHLLEVYWRFSKMLAVCPMLLKIVVPTLNSAWVRVKALVKIKKKKQK